jgi:chaperonin cofactor prefoldin
MLLSAFAYAADHDSLRQRLEDSEQSLKLHIHMLAEQQGQYNELEAKLKGQQQEGQLRAQAPPIPPASIAVGEEPERQHVQRERQLEAAIRALSGRAERTLLREVLRSWRSHCDKVLMLGHMRAALSRKASEWAPSSSSIIDDSTLIAMAEDENLDTDAGPLPSAPVLPPPLLPPLPPLPSAPMQEAAHSPPAVKAAGSPLLPPGLVSRLRWRLALSEVCRRQRSARHLATPAAPCAPPLPVPSPAGAGKGGVAPAVLPATGLSVGLQAAAREAPVGGAEAPLPLKILSKLLPASPESFVASADGHSVRLQHLTTENKFLRERVLTLEASMQQLQREFSEKRELLRHTYVLYHRLLRDPASERHAYVPASPERVDAWALKGLALFRSRDTVQQEADIADGMEAVLEDTLRLNIHLNVQVEQLKKIVAAAAAAGAELQSDVASAKGVARTTEPAMAMAAASSSVRSSSSSSSSSTTVGALPPSREFRRSLNLYD